MNGNPSWGNTSYFEFVLGGPGSVGGAGGFAGSSSGIGSAGLGGWGQVGSIWEDRLWSPTYDGVDTYSCLACVTENPSDGNKGLYLIVEGEVDGPPGMGFETAQSIDPQTGLTVRGVRVPLMSGLASTDAGVTLFRNITRVIKPVTQGFVKLMAFQPKQGASVRTVGHYGPQETLPRYRRIRVNSGKAWLRIRYRIAKVHLLYDYDVLPIASVEAMLMAIKAVFLREANRWDEADKCIALAVQTMMEIQTTEDGGAAQFVMQCDPADTLGTVDLTVIESRIQMSQQSGQRRFNVDKTGWPLGVDSYNSPLFIKDGYIRWLENAVTKGGVIQTRPGMRTRYFFDYLTVGTPENLWWVAAGSPGIIPQGMAWFQPTLGGNFLVFAISGSVWQISIGSNGQLSRPSLIANVSFGATSLQGDFHAGGSDTEHRKRSGNGG